MRRATALEVGTGASRVEEERRHDVRMDWANLLFIHWRVDAALMRTIVPEPLEIDTFDGSAWVGLVPFRMERCSFRGVPRLPGLSDFYECNVRTYARHKGKGGVWFFSLDAETLLPVLGGRWKWNLNYVFSRFAVKREEGITDYRLTRRPGPWAAGATHVRWRVGDPQPPTRAGSLEYFLTERYWLFSRKGGRIVAGEVFHAPWNLRSAELLHMEDSLIAAAGVRVVGDPVVFASEQRAVKGFGLQVV